MEAASSASCLTAPYVIAIELLNLKTRVLGAIIVAISFPVGEMLLGFVAIYVHDYRTLIRVLQIPGLFVFIFFWLIPESVRWLLVTGRFDRAVNILKRIAKVNRKELSQKSIEMLRTHYNSESTIENENCDEKENHSLIQTFGMIVKSKTLSLRFLIGCFQWSSCTFSYYGLGLSATHIAGANRYISFIIVMASEIPGDLIAQLLLPRLKRRMVMFWSLVVGACSIIAIPFIPEEYSSIVLIFFVLSKAAITCAFTSLNLFTMEQWPTNIRNTILNACSMMGRIGSSLAPMTLILVSFFFSF